MSLIKDLEGFKKRCMEYETTLKEKNIITRALEEKCSSLEGVVINLQQQTKISIEKIDELKKELVLAKKQSKIQKYPAFAIIFRNKLTDFEEDNSKLFEEIESLKKEYSEKIKVILSERESLKVSLTTFYLVIDFAPD
jgi:hypothetical protein